MCGVATIIAPRREGLWVREALERADAVQRHRGPDDHGMLVEEHGEHVVGLGHQRLSIIDLSPAGHQPMVSPSGRFAIAFNGEIYNYREIADRLNGDPELQNSASDTAVALAALARWGPEAFRAFNGMWAIVFLDRRSRRLIVSRDRLGVKPLHWCRRDGVLLLASEAKAMRPTSSAVPSASVVPVSARPASVSSAQVAVAAATSAATARRSCRARTGWRACPRARTCSTRRRR